jgi:hypothetical protein
MSWTFSRDGQFMPPRLRKIHRAQVQLHLHDEKWDQIVSFDANPAEDQFITIKLSQQDEDMVQPLGTNPGGLLRMDSRRLFVVEMKAYHLEAHGLEALYDDPRR